MDAQAHNANNGVSRAEKFEDEKRRIIDSLFGKKDRDGSLLESYITHIRIIEDAAYPSSPPPPNSSQDVKKPRVIIVAVRKSGRVSMHKARENANGSFSIGKSWPLDDLSVLESFSGSIPTNADEEQRKQWAGGVGFIVTIGKPYYWQANTEKEKSFFIASLVKIYTKYTGGNSPELIGFDDRERSALGGSIQRAPAVIPPRQVAPQLAAAPLVSNGSGGGSQTQRYQSRDTMPRSQPGPDTMSRTQGPTTPGAGDMRSIPPNTRSPMRTPGLEEFPSTALEYGGGANSQPGQSGLRRVGGANRTQDSFSREDISTSSQKPRDGPSNSFSRMQDSGISAAPQRSFMAENNNSKQQSSNNGPSAPAPLNILPERRRPPVQGLPDLPRSRGRSDEALVPAPLGSPLTRRDVVPPQSSEGQFESTFAGNRNTSESKSAGVSQSSSNPGEAAGSTLDSPISPTASSAEDTSEAVSDARPGLGPMIKKQKSKADIANSLRKAAFAVSAFKPRAGGAAERLRDLGLKSSTEPDGITGVVPAPSLLRAQSNDSARSAATTVTAATATLPTPSVSKETLVNEKPNDIVPEVKVTLPPSEKVLSTEVKDDPVSNIKESNPEPEAEMREVRRKKPTSERTQKELASLGVDPIILDGRSTDFIALLDEFGWVGEGVHTRNIEEMREDIERQINKAQAGGWLTRLEEEDERIVAISTGIDSVIAEVEELDGLLTLYGVELGVSFSCEPWR